MATTRKFGIITDVSGITGGIMINSLSFTENAETAEARNEKGQVTDYAAYSRNTTCNISGVLDESKGSLAKAGSKITFDGKDWIIDSVSKNESNSSFIEVSVSCKSADDAIITIIGEEEESSATE